MAEADYTAAAAAIAVSIMQRERPGEMTAPDAADEQWIAAYARALRIVRAGLKMIDDEKPRAQVRRMPIKGR